MRRAIKMFVLLPVLFGMSKPVKAEAQTCYVASKNAQGFAPDHLGGRPLNHVIGVRIPASQPAFAHAARELRLGKQVIVSSYSRAHANARTREGCLDVAAP
jgi:hypothetical protein